MKLVDVSEKPLAELRVHEAFATCQINLLKSGLPDDAALDLSMELHQIEMKFAAKCLETTQ